MAMLPSHCVRGVCVMSRWQMIAWCFAYSWMSISTVWGQLGTRPVIDGTATVKALKPVSSRPVSELPNELMQQSGNPLLPALDLAREHLAYIRGGIRDYRCQLVKQERIEGRLLPHEVIEVKCRHRQEVGTELQVPFSLYMKWLTPGELRDREALFVEDQFRGDILIRKGGTRNPFLNLWVEPESSMAMRENRYPITEFGFDNLLVRLLEVGEEELQYDDCQVKYIHHAKLDGRDCFGIEVRHDQYRDYFRFHIARIFIDREMRIPVHFEAMGWPTSPGGEPVLMERYRYRDIDLNVGFADEDFDRLNPEYGFRKD